MNPTRPIRAISGSTQFGNINPSVRITTAKPQWPNLIFCVALVGSPPWVLDRRSDLLPDLRLGPPDLTSTAPSLPSDPEIRAIPLSGKAQGRLGRFHGIRLPV